MNVNREVTSGKAALDTLDVPDHHFKRTVPARASGKEAISDRRGAPQRGREDSFQRRAPRPEECRVYRGHSDVKAGVVPVRRRGYIKVLREVQGDHLRSLGIQSCHISSSINVCYVLTTGDTCSTETMIPAGGDEQHRVHGSLQDDGAHLREALRGMTPGAKYVLPLPSPSPALPFLLRISHNEG